MDSEHSFTREIKVVPAWDTGTRERGQHCAELIFSLRGCKGCITFTVYTGWCVDKKNNFPTSPVNIFYHSSSPLDPEDDFEELCIQMGGATCYYNRVGGETNLFATLTTCGTDGLWEEMETLYHELFDKEPEWLVEPYEQMAAAMKQVA